jgi:hypothetical protein
MVGVVLCLEVVSVIYSLRTCLAVGMKASLTWGIRKLLIVFLRYREPSQYTNTEKQF